MKIKKKKMNNSKLGGAVHSWRNQSDYAVIKQRVEQKVSIVIPVYNVEAYLERCVESVLGQTYRNLQIILVDDGSTDSSGALCDMFASRDRRISVLHKANGGLSSARNSGMDKAQGEWIAFIDSDDYVSASYIEDMMQACSRFHVPLSACGRYDVYPSGAIEKKKNLREGRYTRDEVLRSVLAEGIFDVSAWGKLYQRKILEGIYYPQGQLSEDIAVIYDILQRAGSVAHTGKASYYYCHRKGSITYAGFDVKFKSAFQNYKSFWLEVRRNDIRLEAKADAFFIRYLMTLLNGYHYKEMLSSCSEEEEQFYNVLYRLFALLYQRALWNRNLSLRDKGLGLLYYTKTYPQVKKMLVKFGLTSRMEP